MITINKVYCTSKLRFYCAVFSLLMIGFTSCKKLTEVPAPATSITGASVYSSDETAIAVLTGLYSKMAANSIFTGNTSFSIFCGLSSDEMTFWSGSTALPYPYYYKNALALSGIAYTGGSEFWTPSYQYIFVCNSAIEGLNENTSTVTSGVKKQLIGESKFVRALCYFYLVNLYGDVPLILNSDYKTNASLSRTPKADVYKQIITDLLDAKNLLSPNFLNALLNGSSSERVRPSSWAASALLSRAYLYTQDYANAEAEATNMISSNTVFGLSTLNNAFLRAGSGNKEAIWQLQAVGISSSLLNTYDGNYFIIPTTGPNNTQSFYVSNGLLNSFEAGDNRKTSWLASYGTGVNTIYYPYKYKQGSQSINNPSTEYPMVLRLGEQYLIRAEARVQQGTNLSGAIADLNVIRSRAGLIGYNGAADKNSVLSAIMHERQIELFSEWGHRWLDLKRTGTVDAVMGTGGACAAKGGVWNTIQQLYPLPYSDLQLNSNLVQNAGY
ncbi:MAG: RagB/SusD family nutrient uptake outer membrane protein [Bacteroidota bacterium]